ncbi:MAG: DUF1570 domain-containing protein [Aeoliella sp.]
MPIRTIHSSDRRLLRWLLLVAGLAACTAAGFAAENSPTTTPTHVEQVSFARDEEVLRAAGRVVVEDEEGGVLLEEADGRQWVIEAKEVHSRHTTEQRFQPLTSEELVKQMLEELPAGFKTHTTPHYVVCYNTSRAYALWTSSLLERLHRAFTNYWSGKGVEMSEPEFPLVVIVYATADQYRAASAAELGPAASSIIGYYSLTSNRVSMYDLTGTEAVRGGRNRRGSLKEINQMLGQPAALPLVATVVHEATHQIAFNCGLQKRLADLPLWLVEGMAVYFEAPDLSSGRGWRGIGKINYPRLKTFQTNLRTPRRSSLLSLIADDKMLRNSRTAVDAYADAWAINYFLIQYHPDEYVGYVRALSEKQPLVTGKAADRIAEFRKHFGEIAQLEQEFLKRMSRLD